jgi:hypothetical protein
MVRPDAVARVVLTEHRRSTVSIGRVKCFHGGRDSMNQQGTLTVHVSPSENGPRSRIKGNKMLLKESGGAIPERKNLREALVDEIG